MKVLVLNCGSSSVKFQLIDSGPSPLQEGTEKKLAEGTVSNIGLAQAHISYTVIDSGHTVDRHEVVLEHQVAVEIILQLLLKGEDAVLGSLEEIEAVGHRFVHGGEEFSSSVLIDEDVIAGIEEWSIMAPLHNPANLKGYRILSSMLADVPHVAVFDTSFHTSMPERAFLYAIPYSLYEKGRIRRYGFHGTSHRFVHTRTSRLLGRTREECSTITIHLGGGCSIAAIKNGKSIDTSLGFTPLEGLVMGTRSGDIDPSVILYVMEKREVGLHEATTLLNKFSGIAGLSGVSSNMKAVEEAARGGNRRAQLAIDVSCYRIRKYIGAYFAALEGRVDAVVFTAGIGENSTLVRKESCAGLDFLGMHFDDEKNADPHASAIRTEKARSGERLISTDDSPVKIFVIPTNEELVIARDTIHLLEDHVLAAAAS